MDPITQRIWMPSGDSKTDAVWFTDAETNVTAASLNVLDLYNPSATETAWDVPAGVTSISVAVMGCGGGGQQNGSGAAKPVAVGGGEMMWRNEISVTAGQTLYVHAGCANGRSASATSYTGTSGDVEKYISDMSGNTTSYTDSAVTNYSRASYIRTWSSGHKWIAYAAGANLNSENGGNNAGAFCLNASYKYGTISIYNEHGDWRHERGGNGGGLSNENTWWLNRPRGSGGAAGYTGAGGNGANSTGGDGNAGSGGGGGGGSSGPMQGNNSNQSRGGNTFMWGAGDNGIAGDYISNDSSYAAQSDGGDGSKTGTGATNNPPDGLGEGGGGGSEGWAGMNGHRAQYDGWVRIVWSTTGVTRTFPSTNVAYPG